MSAKTFELRRIVTGINDAGRSYAQIDGPPAEDLVFAPGAGLHEIWTSAAGPLERKNKADAGTGKVVLGPPAGAVKLRWFTVAPAQAGMGPEATEAFFAEAFASIGAADHRPDTTRHPGMHLTPTIDFIILVKGRVRLLLDDDERQLSPGDVVVQRGTNHAWICEGDEPALLVAVLIDKEFAD